MRDKGVAIRPAIRLDSGDLAKLSKAAHRMMIEAGLEDPLIVASNDLEEDLIADLKRQGAKINAWGVGTQLITSHDCPALNGVYKLVAMSENGAWQPRMKISSNVAKATNPGRKMVVRYYDANDQPMGDVLCDADESWTGGGEICGRDYALPHREVRIRGAARAESLLHTVFERGRRVVQPPIHEIRSQFLNHLAALPDEYKRLRNPHIYRVVLSERIGELKDEFMKSPDLV
jgi:nicotinate phosphoribosyltransferase